MLRTQDSVSGRKLSKFANEKPMVQDQLDIEDDRQEASEPLTIHQTVPFKDVFVRLPKNEDRLVNKIHLKSLASICDKSEKTAEQPLLLQ